MLFLARVVLTLHVVFVAFTVLGLAFLVTGSIRKWSWARNPAFRLTHLAAIGFVVARAWCGVPCFLTTAETWLRERAERPAPANDFDRIGESLVLRSADPEGFRNAATGWGVLTVAALSLSRTRRKSPVTASG